MCNKTMKTPTVNKIYYCSSNSSRNNYNNNNIHKIN